MLIRYLNYSNSAIITENRGNYFIRRPQSFPGESLWSLCLHGYSIPATGYISEKTHPLPLPGGEPAYTSTFVMLLNPDSSHLTSQISNLKSHISFLTPHISHLTSQISFLTTHISYLKSQILTNPNPPPAPPGLALPKRLREGEGGEPFLTNLHYISQTSLLTTLHSCLTSHSSLLTPHSSNLKSHISHLKSHLPIAWLLLSLST